MRQDRQIPVHPIKTRWTSVLIDSTDRTDQMRTLACWFTSLSGPARTI